MKILHTSDWHVGKVLKGRPRLNEHIAVLAQVVQIAHAERPDLVVVAGDLYDTVSPSPDATRVVTRALSALRAGGAAVVVVGGNHDNGATLDALRPWAEAAGVTLRGTVRDSAVDHLITGQTEAGERWRLVALPFLSQRYAVRATEMYQLTAAEAVQTYADHIGRLIAKLAEGFDDPGAVNLVTAHLTVVGGRLGGGERDAHTIMGYAVPTTVFPGTAHYVALGHLHRAQQVLGPCPIRYSGSPLAIDFGEEENTPSVTLVDVTAETAAKAREVPITAAVPLRTVRGTLDDLARVAETIRRESQRESQREALPVAGTASGGTPGPLTAGTPGPLTAGTPGAPTTGAPAGGAAAGGTPGTLTTGTLTTGAPAGGAAAGDTPVTLAGGAPAGGIAAGGTPGTGTGGSAGVEPWLRVFVREQPRAGLREEVQELLPRALEIRIDPDLLPAAGSGRRVAQRAGRSPRDLFADYLGSKGNTGDDGVRELFDQLYEEEVSRS